VASRPWPRLAGSAAPPEPALTWMDAGGFFTGGGEAGGAEVGGGGTAVDDVGGVSVSVTVADGVELPLIGGTTWPAEVVVEVPGPPGGFVDGPQETAARMMPRSTTMAAITMPMRPPRLRGGGGGGGVG